MTVKERKRDKGERERGDRVRNREEEKGERKRG